MSLMKESPNQKENINETAKKHDHEMNKILANTDIFVGTYDSYLLSYKIKSHNEVNLCIYITITVETI